MQIYVIYQRNQGDTKEYEGPKSKNKQKKLDQFTKECEVSRLAKEEGEITVSQVKASEAKVVEALCEVKNRLNEQEVMLKSLAANYEVSDNNRE